MFWRRSQSEFLPSTHKGAWKQRVTYAGPGTWKRCNDGLRNRNLHTRSMWTPIFSAEGNLSTWNPEMRMAFCRCPARRSRQILSIFVRLITPPALHMTAKSCGNGWTTPTGMPLCSSMCNILVGIYSNETGCARPILQHYRQLIYRIIEAAVQEERMRNPLWVLISRRLPPKNRLKTRNAECFPNLSCLYSSVQ